MLYVGNKNSCYFDGNRIQESNEGDTSAEGDTSKSPTDVTSAAAKLHADSTQKVQMSIKSSGVAPVSGTLLTIDSPAARGPFL